MATSELGIRARSVRALHNFLILLTLPILQS